MDVRTTRHTIDEQEIEFTVVAPTGGNHITRRLTITNWAGENVSVQFDHDGFQLFKKILNEY
jgi:hypothetical protein